MGNFLSRLGSWLHIDGNCLLHLAVERGYQKSVTLLASRCDVNALDSKGRTALSVACLKEFPQIATVLLDSGALVDQACSNSYGIAPLHIAVTKGRLDCVKLLLSRGADVHLLAHDITPFELACSFGHWSIADELLDGGVDINEIYGSLSGGTLLHRAALEDNEKMTEFLLARNADIEALNYSGLSTLQIAVSNRDSKVAKLLLRNGACADMAITAADGWTPLLVAVTRKLKGNVELLLNHKADVCGKSVHGFTPLHWICGESYSNTAEGAIVCAGIVELLLEWGADVNAENEDGETPLLMFFDRWPSSGHGAAIVELFAKHFAKMRALDLFVDPANVEAISACETYADFSARCDGEIRRMRRSKINFFSLLTMAEPEPREVDYASYEGVPEVLASQSFVEEFPIYAGQIRKKFAKGQERRDLQRQSDVVLTLGDLRCLPYDCLMKLNSYLSDEDLRNVIRPKPGPDGAVN